MKNDDPFFSNATAIGAVMFTNINYCKHGNTDDAISTTDMGIAKHYNSHC